MAINPERAAFVYQLLCVAKETVPENLDGALRSVEEYDDLATTLVYVREAQEHLAKLQAVLQATLALTGNEG